MDKKPIFITPAKSGTMPYSPAMIANGFVFISGQLPINEDGEMPDNIKEQTAQVMKNIEVLLNASGSSFNKVVKTTVFITDMSCFSDMNEVYACYFEGDFPARAAVEVSKLAKGAKVEIDAIAIV